MHEKLFLNIFFGGDIVNKQSKRAFGFKQKKQIASYYLQNWQVI